MVSAQTVSDFCSYYRNIIAMTLIFVMCLCFVINNVFYAYFKPKGISLYLVHIKRRHFMPYLNKVLCIL